MTDTEDSVTGEPAGLLSRWSRNKARSRLPVTELDGAEDTPSDQAGKLPQPLADAAQEIVENENFPEANGEGSATHSDALVASPLEETAGESEDDNELILTDEDMPALETLNAESDYSGFLNKGVSPELRKKALQHLFRMPKFNIRDGLNDYDEDYTYFEPLGDTVTSDMRWHAERKEREAREAEEARQAEEALLAENAEQENAHEMSADEATPELAQTETLENQAETSQAELTIDQAVETETVLEAGEDVVLADRVSADMPRTDSLVKNNRTAKTEEPAKQGADDKNRDKGRALT